MDEDDETPVSLSECLDYLERIEREVARTPMLVPPPEGVAHFLATRCGPEAVAALGSRLVERGDGDREWRTKALVLYLGQVDDPAAAETLQRFAAATQRDDYRDLAGRTLVAIADRKSGKHEV